MGCSRISARFSALVLLVAAGMLLAACSWLPEEEEKLAPPLVEPAEIQYVTETVTRGTLTEEISMTGSFSPKTEIALSFESQGGRIKSLLVDNREQVSRGDLIAQLDTGSLEMSIRLQEINVEKARLTLAQLKASKADSYSIKKADLDLQQQQIQLSNLENQLEASSILAPIDGQVTYLTSVDVGEQIAAFQTVVKLSDTSSMKVLTSDTDADQLPIGAEVRIEFQDVSLSGIVIANPTSLLTDPDASLKGCALIDVVDELPESASLGRQVRICYIKEQREDVLYLPRSYINTLSGRTYVNVLEDGVRIEKDIEIGMRTQTQAEIVTGLDEDDLIIIN